MLCYLQCVTIAVGAPLALCNIMIVVYASAGGMNMCACADLRRTNNLSFPNREHGEFIDGLLTGPIFFIINMRAIAPCLCRRRRCSCPLIRRTSIDISASRKYREPSTTQRVVFFARLCEGRQMVCLWTISYPAAARKRWRKNARQIESQENINYEIVSLTLMGSTSLCHSRPT